MNKNKLILLGKFIDENILEVKEKTYKFTDIMNFKEAATIWGLNDSTLRKLVTTSKVTEGIDYRKSGNIWLITKDCMIRVYGEREGI